MQEDNGQKNPGESYIKKYQKHIACSQFSNKFSINPFNTYLGKNVVYNFINSMIEESNYCSEVMKKRF